MKSAAESAMREVVGETPIAQALSEGRGKIETDTQALLQGILNAYGAGIEVTQLQLLKVDPPAPVIDAFRDVQRALADRERLRNEAESYRNDIIPRARGDAVRIKQEAEAYRQEIIARAQGDADRFLSVYNAFKAAQDVTLAAALPRDDGRDPEEQQQGDHRQIRRGRERRASLSAAACSGQSWVRQCGASGQHRRRQLGRRTAASAERRRRRQPFRPCGVNEEAMVNRRMLTVLAVVLVVAGIFTMSSLFIVDQTEEALVLQFGQPRRVIRDPGLQVKRPFIENVIFYDNRLLDFEPPPEEVIVSDQKRLVVDTYTRYRIIDPLLFYQTVSTEAAVRARLNAMVSGSLRRVLGNVTLSALLSHQRSAIMGQIRDEVSAQGKSFGINVIDVRIRRADLPEENSQAIFARMKSEREQQAAQYRGEGAEAAQTVRANAERERTVHPRRSAAAAPRRCAATAMRRASRSMPAPLGRTRSSLPSTARCRPIATR